MTSDEAICFIKKLFSKSGRIKRSEFIVTSILSTVFGLPIIEYFLVIKIDPRTDSMVPFFTAGFLGCVAALIGIFAQIKRLHDIGRSGKIWFVFFIAGFWYPVGMIMHICLLLYLAFYPSDKDNKYGLANQGNACNEYRIGDIFKDKISAKLGLSLLWFVAISLGVFMMFSTSPATKKAAADTTIKINKNLPKISDYKDVKKYNNWTQAVMEGVGSFQIPPTMEVGEITEAGNNEVRMLVAKQKRRRDSNIDSLKTFAHISLMDIKLDSELVPRLGSKLNMTQDELNAWEKDVLNSLNELEGKNQLFKFSNFQKLKIINVNGIDCIYYYYERSRNKINVYMFFNKDTMQEFKVEYRIADANIWEAEGQDIRNVIYTLQLTKR